MKKQSRTTKESTVVKKKFLSNSQILHLSLKALLMTVIFGSAIYYLDQKGYFNADETNNHTQKKWASFYKFSKKNNVDILLFGNSHLYSGINPKNLSITLGANAFILASPGTSIADSYYGLVEALKFSDPKLIVLETYGMTAFNPYEFKKGALSDQIKSFNARKDFVTKIISTPFLFKSDNYAYARSNTLRNHDFFFKDFEQLSKNYENERKPKNNKLYLGRFVRFQKGIKQEIMNKYDSLGAPVKASDFEYNEYTDIYLKKTVDLCAEKNIQLLFLTLPMYHKHVDDYPLWNNKMKSVLGKFKNPWLNLQDPIDSVTFDRNCFESTYKRNQHMTYQGSLIATYKLASFIKSKVVVELPKRKADPKWKKIFYGEEGYFENLSALTSDKNNKILCKNLKYEGLTLAEVLEVKPESGKNRLVIAKIKKIGKDIRKCKLKIAIVVKLKSKRRQRAYIDLIYDRYHELDSTYIFKAMIKPIDITEVTAAKVLCTK